MLANNNLWSVQFLCVKLLPKLWLGSMYDFLMCCVSRELRTLCHIRNIEVATKPQNMFHKKFWFRIYCSGKCALCWARNDHELRRVCTLFSGVMWPMENLFHVWLRFMTNDCAQHNRTEKMKDYLRKGNVHWYHWLFISMWTFHSLKLMIYPMARILMKPKKNKWKLKSFYHYSKRVSSEALHSFDENGDLKWNKCFQSV